MTTKEIQEEINRYAALGYVPSTTTVQALLEMANRWAKAEARKREARNRAEREAAPAALGTVRATRALVQSIMSSISPNWHELLDTAFRLPNGPEIAWGLPDGTEVTWSVASADEHELTSDALIHSIASSIEEAARHQQAADEIRAAQSNTLWDLLR